MSRVGDPFGVHRVLEPPGVLPQVAWKIDNDFSRLADDEILIDVETLNVDAASFRQMEEAAGGSEEGIAAAVRDTVAKRGKQHNPVTGSGGMLLGRIAAIGPALAGRTTAGVGDRIATLVSLSLTPLRIDEVRAVRKPSAQLDVRGQAVLFATGAYAVMPTDLPERVALAALDVAGAAPHVARICATGQSVLVLGAGGKSGMLCATEARRRVGPGRVIGLEASPRAAADLRALGVCDVVIDADARDALAVREAVLAANDGAEVDATVSCVNVEGAEMAAILSTRERGKVLFFAMTTSFTRAALGAEGAGRDLEMLIGNGYATHHAEHTLDLLRTTPALRALFEKRYA